MWHSISRIFLLYIAYIFRSSTLSTMQLHSETKFVHLKAAGREIENYLGKGIDVRLG